MKATGILRRVDSMGRVAIPKEIRRAIGINIGDAFEIFTDDTCMVLKKYEPGCIFCGECEGVVEYDKKRICASCAAAIKDLASAKELEEEE